MDFVLIINSTPEITPLLKNFVSVNNVTNIIFSEPFNKKKFSPDLMKGHMLNLQLIQKMNDIDYVTFFASNCLFYKNLEHINPRQNIFSPDFFDETIRTTDLHEEKYSFYLNKLGMSRPGIYKLNIEHFNPVKPYFKSTPGGWLHKISSDYSTVKKYITQGELYYNQFEGMTITKSTSDRMTDYYWNNDLDEKFNNFDEWVLEEIFLITYFMNNGESFFYLGFNSDINQIEKDMQAIKANKNDFYMFKINHRIPQLNDQIINFYRK